jgi:hypothetical protein
MAARFLPLDQSDPVEIAGYSLRARLGAGGMGNVYLSFTRGGRPVAVKAVRKEFADDPEFRRRFRQEITVAQRVQGLYTAPVLDADPDAAIPWLATAYIAGPPLSQAVTEHGPFPMLSVFRLLGGVAEGLTAIHGAGLVHRDLKPANVLLAEDGPRVIDFGIAYAADATTLTTSGVIMGTPAYMAPEQVAGRAVTAATDVFALAHLVVYAATGHTLFGDGNVSALVYRIVNEKPNLDGCPASLREIAERCLAKNPEERPDLAEVMAFSRQMLSGRTMATVGASWLPGPVAETLAAYGTNAAPPAPLPQAPQPPVTAGMPVGPAVTRQDAPYGQPLPGMSGGYQPGMSGGYQSGGYQPTVVPGGTGGPGVPVTMPVTAPGSGSTPPPAKRRRGVRRPAVLVPAVLVLVALIALGGAYLGGRFNGAKTVADSTTPPAPSSPTASASLAVTSAPPTSASAPASTAAATTSPTTSASATAAPTTSTSGGIANATSTTYSTSEPFPLCDPTSWLLTNLAVAGTNGCEANMQVTNSAGGYGFGTAAKFSSGLTLAADNTTTFTGALPASTQGNECMGVAEGNTAIGYYGYLCDDGTWYVKDLIGLGTTGVIVGKQVATGSFPYTAQASYDVTFKFAGGKGTLSISLAQGAVNSIAQSFSTGQFTPTAVGYGFYIGQGYSGYPATVSGFAYATN